MAQTLINIIDDKKILSSIEEAYIINAHKDMSIFSFLGGYLKAFLEIKEITNWTRNRGAD